MNESYQSPLKRALQLLLQPCWLSSSWETSVGHSPNHFTFFPHIICVAIHLYFAVFTFSFSLLELLVTGEKQFGVFFQYGKQNWYCRGSKSVKIKICSELEYCLLSYQLLFMQRYGNHLVGQITVSQKLETVCLIVNKKWHPCTKMKMNTESFPVDIQWNSR